MLIHAVKFPEKIRSRRSASGLCVKASILI